ncbi:HPr family phosphocarrier protein [Oceanirhabdus sp. W0125-5]|uniref:HPr family phosphocarrier protein n=1 Tax=Oceanirhabdus sp. W0125-5 TaxID=2999116 RepID=UPI0022F2A86F|nr:HPr family phosphocarrier protein [Oceanirhabdus sp. W0125-5]WBW94752.1 HPr family phosphocarrier protein [Oceanirhabdus sp. W0125-5]
MEKIVKVLNESGLHARPAGALVKEASKFGSEIFIEAKGTKANAKSIMNVMCLGLKKDDEVKIIAEGADADAAITAISDLFENKFGE